MTTILITGAATGFGKGVALGLAQRGHRVIAGVETSSQVWQLRQDAEAADADLQVIKLDITNPMDRDHAFTFDIDVLFNNAGVMFAGPATEVPEELWRKSFDVNLFGGLAMARGFVPALVEKGAGKIVWTSSIAGLTIQPFTAAYVASKHAIEAVAGVMREELKPHGIIVQTINPAAYLTGFNDTGVTSIDEWFDAKTAVIKPDGILDGLKNQLDPAEVIEAMIAVLTGESRAYRTVVPPEAADELKKQQAAEWELTI
jgi:NAD(P)-dependent dehydrogenase (short-subunit alcohol dehydrogenase family)